MNKIELKNKLLSSGVFDDNSYLDKYVELIIKNKSNKYLKGSMQVHHIMPKMYFIYNNIPVDNSYSNKVNLLYCDHVLAHYLLSFAFKDNIFKYKNMCAIDIILGALHIALDDIVEKLPDIQLYYESNSKLRSEFNCMNDTVVKSNHDEIMRSEAVRSSISKSIKEIRKATKDYVTIHNNRECKRVPPEDVARYLSQGWEVGSNQKNMIVLHKDNIETKVWPDDVEKYLSEGWEKGGRPGRITPEQRKALDNSHKNISDNFRKEQSERLKKYFQEHPDAKYRRSYPVRLFNENAEFIFPSAYDAAIFLGYSSSTASSGIVKSFLDDNGRVRKKGPYHNWTVEIYKGGDNDDKVNTN